MPAAKPRVDCQICGQPTTSVYGICDRPGCSAHYQRAYEGKPDMPPPAYCLCCGAKLKNQDAATRLYVCARPGKCHAMRKRVSRMLKRLEVSA